MTEDAHQPAGSTGGDGHWQGWRWVIAAASVVVFVVAIQLLTSRERPSVSEPVSYAAALQLSAQHFQAGRYQEARDAAQAALAANPESADAYNNLALAYLELGMHDEGIQAARNAIRLRPDYQLARNNLAWIEEEKASAALPRVQAAEREQAVALLNQSLEHTRAGRFSACVDAATQAADLNPNLAAAFSNRGFCTAKLLQWDEAIRYTQEAIRLDPNFQLARANLAWMEQEKLKSRAGDVQ